MKVNIFNTNKKYNIIYKEKFWSDQVFVVHLKIVNAHSLSLL